MELTKKPFRFLVVEDDEEMAKITKELLLDLKPDHFQEGCHREYSVDIAANQHQADELIHNAYDMIILDLMYPQADEPLSLEDSTYAGMEWLPKLRQLCPRTPVVVQTSYPGDRNFALVVEAIKRGWAKDFIPKGTTGEDEIGLRLQRAWSQARVDRQVDHITDEVWRLMRSSLMRVAFEDMTDASGRARLKLSNIASRLDVSTLADVSEEIRSVSENLRQNVELSESVFERDPEPVEVDLNGWLDHEFLPLFARLYEDRGKELNHRDGDREVVARIRPNDLKVLLFEILSNSLTMLDDDPPYQGTKTRIQVTPLPTGAEISIEDDGSGVGAEDQDRIFKPGFSSRKNSRREEQHRGHGRYLVRRLLWSMGGDIRVEPAKSFPRGTLVVMTLRNL